MTESEKRLLLLQVTDSVFPIGAYSHSYGVETYVQAGIVTDAGQAGALVGSYIRYSLVYNDLMAIRFAYERAGCADALAELEEQIGAARAAMEIRSAGNKLAARFIKTAGGYLPEEKKAVWQTYAAGRKGSVHQYAVSYGVFCALAGIGLTDSLTFYAYSQVSGMVVNCVKMIPLSQTVGQNLLFSFHGTIADAVAAAVTSPEKYFLRSAPGFELRGMQHEGLYSRIYMS